MSRDDTYTNKGETFRLEKWYLDFVGPDGCAMIFYAARLKWHGLGAVYTSWLEYTPVSGTRITSRFGRVNLPEISGDQISWSDRKTAVSGIWEATGKPLYARLFESSDGYLDWHCHQSSSKVILNIGVTSTVGEGYAEQLIMTVPAWKIPMDELRWGRLGAEDNQMVWIEIREREKRQWLWLNGEKIPDCIVGDNLILLPEKGLSLSLGREVSLESEKKIFTVVEKLVRYLPGFKRAIPLQFLMADEHKWLSRGELNGNGLPSVSGWAIHELVNFNTRKP